MVETQQSLPRGVQDLSKVAAQSRAGSIEVDVLVVGGGVSGLETARRCAEHGLRTALIEKSIQVGGGASTRNEGWVHAGTYHAQAIDDEEHATVVTQSTLAGHDYFAREAVEERLARFADTYAFTENSSRVRFIEDRWARFNVQHVRVKPKDLRRSFPGIDTRRIAAAYKVEDFAINTQRLLARLCQRVRISGGLVETGCEVTSQNDDGSYCLSTTRGTPMNIRPRVVVVTSGVGSRDLCKAVWGIELVQGFYRSHLLIARPVRRLHSIFSLDAGGVTLMVHGKSIDPSAATYLIGLNRDAEPLPGPDYSIVEAHVEQLALEAQALVGHGFDEYEGYACVKTDIGRKSDNAIYDLRLRVHELRPGC